MPYLKIQGLTLDFLMIIHLASINLDRAKWKV